MGEDRFALISATPQISPAPTPNHRHSAGESRPSWHSLSPRPRRGDTYRQLAYLRDRTRRHWLIGAPNKRSLIAYDH